MQSLCAVVTVTLQCNAAQGQSQRKSGSIGRVVAVEALEALKCRWLAG